MVPGKQKIIAEKYSKTYNMKETKTDRRKTASKSSKTKSKKLVSLEQVIKVRTRKPKIFVLDTNVLLHDWRTIWLFLWLL